tara:strand:+ start:154 stop:645 length:492 start_codon:yes stop_codon:yes gene_type:complete
MGMFDEIKVPKSYLKGLLTKDQEKLLSGNNYQTKSFENFLAQYKIYRQRLYLKDAECSTEEKWVRTSHSGKVNFYDSMADQDGNEWWAEFDFLFKDGVLDKKEVVKFEMMETAEEAKRKAERFLQTSKEQDAIRATFKYKFFNCLNRFFYKFYLWSQKKITFR